MDTKKVIIIAGLAFALCWAVVNLLAVKRQTALTVVREKAGLEQGARALTRNVARSTSHLNSPAKESVSPHVIAAQAPVAEKAAAARQIQPPRASPDFTRQQIPPAQQPGSQKATAQDPLAREALSLVGENAEANEYWAMAINDPSLPEEERKNLIEDLNEDGLSDSKHPGQEDLPLILNRIEIIEELAPYAMDQVNSDAFAEAYKDLLNMLNGQPVQ